MSLTACERAQLAELEAVNAEHGDDPRLEGSDFFDELYRLRAKDRPDRSGVRVTASTPPS